MTRSGAIACVLAGALMAAWGASAQTSLFGQPAAPAEPLQPPASAAAKPAPKAKATPRGPVPARALLVSNETTATVTGLEVAGEGKTAAIGKPLPPKGRTTLKLPAMKGCLVTVTAALDGAEADTTSQDICKDRTIRFVE